MKIHYFIFIFMLLSSCKSTEYYQNQYTTKANKEKVYSLNQNFEARVKRVSGSGMYIDMGKNYYTYDGYYYATITLDIKNISNEKLAFYFDGFKLVNENGKKYDIKFISYGPFYSKYFDPEQSKSKDLVFLCDANFKPYMLINEESKFAPIKIDYISTK